ncbi:MAG: ribosome-associated protein [Bacteriovoracaceae bacterium]|nr:ribosome-associated protein [Bacteriovoracaceae bacterium]
MASDTNSWRSDESLSKIRRTALAQKNSSTELALWMAQLLDKKGGKHVNILDVRELSSITDFMVIASGTSLKHIETLVNAPSQELRKSGFPADAIEGLGTSWVVADFNDVIIHVFDEPTRKHYDLETLWSAAPKVDWEPKKHSLQSLAL